MSDIDVPLSILPIGILTLSSGNWLVIALVILLGLKYGRSTLTLMEPMLTGDTA